MNSDDPLSMELEDLQSYKSGFYFSFATLVQGRPDNVRFYEHQAELEHERSHWFQYCGTTYGCLLASIRRAEEIILLDAFGELRKSDTGELAAVEAALSVGPLLNPNGSINQADQLPVFFRDAVAQTVRLRRATKLMFDAQVGWPSGWSKAKLLSEAVKSAWKVYASHTGSVRPTSDGQSESYLKLVEQVSLVPDRSISPVVIDNSELTTRHLFEANSVLCEWGGILSSGYSCRFVGGSKFEGLPDDRKFDINDGLRERVDSPGSRYGLVLQLAIQKLRSANTINESWCDADVLCAAMSVVIACLDISLNPIVPPLAIATRLDWSKLYPPSRFLSALEAVCKIDFPLQIPAEIEYRRLRQEICDVASLEYGEMLGRSFQHPNIRAEVFGVENPNPEFLPKMSHFDYLIWVFESIQTFRKHNSFCVAYPYALSRPSYSGDNLRVLAEQKHLWSRPPLHRKDGDIACEHRISTEFGMNLCTHLMKMLLLRQILVRPGSFDITSHYPEKFLKIPGLVEHLLESLCATTGMRSIANWNVKLPKREQEPCTSTPSRKRPRAAPRKYAELVISRQAIVEQDHSKEIEFLTSLRSDPDSNRGTLRISVDGYNNDRRQLWEISEVLAFFRATDEGFPYWFWYLPFHDQEFEWTNATVACLVAEDNGGFSHDAILGFMHRCFVGFNEEAKNSTQSADDIERASQDACDFFNYFVRNTIAWS